MQQFTIFKMIVCILVPQCRSPLEPSQNDVWVTSAEIPYWWCVTTQILVVLLIGWTKFPRVSTNQKHYLDLGTDASSVWNFCARYSDVVLRGLKWRPRETSAVFSGFEKCHLHKCVEELGTLISSALSFFVLTIGTLKGDTNMVDVYQLQDAIGFEDSKECWGQQRLLGFHQFEMTRLSSSCLT